MPWRRDALRGREFWGAVFACLPTSSLAIQYPYFGKTGSNSGEEQISGIFTLSSIQNIKKMCFLRFSTFLTPFDLRINRWPSLHSEGFCWQFFACFWYFWAFWSLLATFATFFFAKVAYEGLGQSLIILRSAWCEQMPQEMQLGISLSALPWLGVRATLS